ncbi:hypothetical protein KUW04_06185 [Halomonas denitrificans]|nr:hypothetical protein [Halomonas denitrificans]
MEFIRNNWEWISTHPWLVITIALMFFVLGWNAANLFYKERMELLKEKSNNAPKENSKPEAFKYPKSGRYGKNILSNSVITTSLNEKVALRAETPQNSRILIEMLGPKSLHKSDLGGSWQMSMSKLLNWTCNTYDFDNGGRQEFTAENGVADLELEFLRPGEVTINVFEGEDCNPSWQKKITVKE